MVLGTNLQSFRGWKCQEGEKRWSIDACLYCCRIFPLPFFFLPLCFLFFCSLILSFLLTLLFIASSYSWLPPFLLYCLIPWDFSLLSLKFHQLFLASCEHPFRITHWLVGYSATTSIQSVLAAPLFILGQNSRFCLSPFPLPLYAQKNAIWVFKPCMIQMFCHFDLHFIPSFP